MSDVNDNKYASLESLKTFLDYIKLLIDMHDVSTSSHYDMRAEIEDIGTRLSALADCDDETLDQISEIVAYVKDNRELIEQITTAKVSVSDLINLVYPIGSIYMSTNNISPATFLGGTWERIENRFLLASGTHVAGETGGESEHTLTVNEMPSHRHSIMSGSREYANIQNGVYISRDILFPRDTTEASYRYLDYINYEGGSRPHNNMPPYLVVYMWKRTA